MFYVSLKKDIKGFIIELKRMIKTGVGFLCGSGGSKQGENRLKKIIMIFTGCLLLSGCAKVHHLDRLLTLKDLADEQALLNQYVHEQNRNFELMLEEVKAGTLDRHSNKKRIRRAFGDPVYARNVKEGDQELESWLYRYATEYFGAEKIYLYFDLDGNFVKSEYIEGTNGESGQETTPEDGYQEI